MKKIALAYFGTPDFSAEFLEKLLADKKIPVEVKFVVTQPDKKVGRKQTLTPSPVKLIALKYKIPVVQAEEIKDVDLGLLFAFGDILKKEILTKPKHGFWNIHPSLLPKYRGASPVAYPLIEGEEETGVTLIQMDEVMDHGSIIAREKVAILPKEKRNELTGRLVDVAFGLFERCIMHLAKNEPPYSQAQDETAATYTKLLVKEDGFIPLNDLKDKMEEAPLELFNKFRGLYPWPGIWTKVDINGEEKRLKISELDYDGVRAIIKKVQLEGKNEVSFVQFNQAYKVF